MAKALDLAELAAELSPGFAALEAAPKEPEAWDSHPAMQGPYVPSREKDSCGVGMYASPDGNASHNIVEGALQNWHNVDHRGAKGSEVDTGDGAGMFCAMPDSFMRKVDSELGINSPEPGKCTDGNVFLAEDEGAAKEGNSIAQEDLPWELFFDLGAERWYWTNHITKECVWAQPEETLAPGWHEVFDPKSQKEYYYHEITFAVRWDKPVDDGLVFGWSEAYDPRTSMKYYYNMFTREAQWERPKRYFFDF